MFTSKLVYIVPIVSCNQHERQTTTSNTAPASIIKPYFDVIPPPTTYKLMCQLKKPNVFGNLAQKRNFITNRVLLLRPDILQMICIILPFLKDFFVDTLPMMVKGLQKRREQRIW